MRKTILLVILLSGVGWTQCAKHQTVAQTLTGVIPSPSVRVCSEPALGLVCTPLITIYSDRGCTQALPNPMTGDAQGNVIFYAVPNRVHLQINASVISQIDVADESVSDSLLPSWQTKTVAFSATPVFDISSASLFLMSLTGNVTSSTVTNSLNAAQITSGRIVSFEITQGTGGPWTFTWPSNFSVPPIINATGTTNLSFWYDGTNWRLMRTSTFSDISFFSNARNCRADGMTCDGVTDDGAIINKCVTNARLAGQSTIALPGACRFLIGTTLNFTNFPGLQIIGGAEDENVLFATLPTITQGICNTALTSNVCADATGSGKLVMEHLSLISQTSQTHPSTIGVVTARDNFAGGGNGLYCYAENNLFVDVSISMDHMAGANGGAGSIAFYDVGAERPTWINSGTTADIGTFLAPTNDLGVTSPYQTIQTGCASSMTFPIFINSYSQVIGSGPGMLIDAVSGGNIIGHDFVGTSASSTGPAMQFQTAPSSNWNVIAASETFNGGAGIGGAIATSVNIDHSKFDITEAGLTNGPDQGFFWFGANNLVISDVDLRVNSVLNGVSNSPVVSNNGTNQTWNGGSIEMSGTASPLNASNVRLVDTRVVAWDRPAANVTFAGSSTYRLTANDAVGFVGTYKFFNAPNFVAGFSINGVAPSGNVAVGNGTNFVAAQLNFNQLAGSLACSQMPAHTGDVTSSAGSCATTVVATHITGATTNTVMKSNAGGNMVNSSILDDGLNVTMAEAIFGISGSGVAPGYAFSAENSLGLFRVSLNTMGFASNGATRVLFNATEVRLGSGVGVEFSSNANPAAAGPDSNVSRVAASVVGVGNGNIGDVSGEIRSAKFAAVYNAAGTQQTAAHIVEDTCTLGTNCAVTLAGSAAFTSSSSYRCTCSDATATNACRVNQTAGNTVTFTGTGTDVISYTCSGN